ncbi:MFS transporter [Pseudomonas hunanensis]|uniref:MFS transporter n=1 Tax=Pseudomonas hunanensis TaxID=1247546 RepID=UPI0030D916B1
MSTKAQDTTLSLAGLMALVTGQLLPQIDFSIVNVALDVMGQSLRAGETGLVLIVSLYGLSFAALISTGGRLGDRYGRKRVFLIGIAGFCIASAICGLAADIFSMLVGRVLQGGCAALLLPQIIATIHTTLEGDRHRQAVGFYTAIAGLSVVIGQVLGGGLVSANLWNLSWRIAFFINVPLCLIILFIGHKVIPETRIEKTQSMDIGGILWFVVCLLFLLVPVTLGNEWPNLWWLLLGVLPSGWCLWKFEQAQELAGHSPILPPSLFKTPRVVNGFISEMTVTFAYPGYLFVTALCLQNALHFTPLQSGNTFIALGIMFFIGSLTSKPLSNLLGDRNSYVIGLAFTVIGFIATVLLIHSHTHELKYYQLWGATGAVGFGNAIMLTSAYRITLSCVSKNHASEASSALITVQQGCFALGTAFSGALYTATLKRGYLDAITLSIAMLSVLVVSIGGCNSLRTK